MLSVDCVSLMVALQFYNLYIPAYKHSYEHLLLLRLLYILTILSINIAIIITMCIITYMYFINYYLPAKHYVALLIFCIHVILLLNA